MFLRTLRNLRKIDEGLIYSCKGCGCDVIFDITDEEYESLRKGIPPHFILSTSCSYFFKRVCLNCFNKGEKE